MNPKKETEKRIQSYLKKNDKLFAKAEEENSLTPQAVIVAISPKPLWTHKQAAKFMAQVLNFPIETEQIAYNPTGNTPPGLTITTRGWIHPSNDGYFYICSGGSKLYFTDRRFY